MRSGGYKGGAAVRKFQDQLNALDARRCYSLGVPPLPEGVDFHSCLAKLLAEQDERQLTEQFRLLGSLFRHGHFPTAMDPQPLGSMILSCLTNSSDELLTIAIVQFLDVVFARPETDEFGLFLLRNGMCSDCARLFASVSLLPYVLRLFCNIAGGTIEEKSMTEAILPVELIRDLILDPSNRSYSVQLRHLLRIYSHFEMDCSQSVVYFSVFGAIWRN
jgi:hypothetical protein